MQYNIPRWIVAGTNSGCGKTTVTCAILQALVNRGLRPAAFKCGPDYIDPMFHSRIIGAKSSNLDAFFFSDNTLRYLLGKNAAGCDVGVIEGVMGYYDGMGLRSTQGSTYEIAQKTKSPVLLTVGARGASLSVLAVIQGFLTLCPENHIRGVILNHCTASTYKLLAEEIRSRFSGAVEPLGYLPEMKECRLESRHLGLVTAGEVENLRGKTRLLAEQAERSLDLDGILRLAREAPPLTCEPVLLPRKEESIRVAVARDAAFCFYYEDSLEALEEMGAELVPFSPLADEALPEDIQGLYLGGGYPELYAERLSRNVSLRREIHSALARGLPCIAECGGYMYLTQAIDGFPMVQHLPGECRDTGKLCRFGYVTLTARRENLLCRAGESIRAHEFHHWDCDVSGDSFTAVKNSGRSWEAVCAGPTLCAGYPHFHFYANPRFAERFYEACVKEKQKNAGGEHSAHGHREAEL